MESTTTTPSEHRAYIASLAHYNAGRLVGFWMDLTGKTGEEMEEEATAWISAQRDEWGQQCEEYAVHDWEGCTSSIFGEYPDWEAVAEYVEMTEEHGEAYTVYLNSFYGNGDGSPQDFRERYAGKHESAEYWAMDYMAECMSIPEHLEPYIDYKRYLIDCEGNGWRFYRAAGGGVHVINGSW